jgi:hypothetical protein
MRGRGNEGLMRRNSIAHQNSVERKADRPDDPYDELVRDAWAHPEIHGHLVTSYMDDARMTGSWGPVSPGPKMPGKDTPGGELE